VKLQKSRGAAKRRKSVATAEGRGDGLRKMSRGAAEDSFAAPRLGYSMSSIHGFPPWLHSIAAARLMLSALLLLSACRQQMAHQPRYEPLEESAFFPDHRSARPLPIGVIARGFLDEDEHLYTGRVNGQLATTFPFEITADILARGQDRYTIFCTPCHDQVGNGNGMAVRRGFRRGPPSFHIDRLREAPPGHFYDVVSNGFGAMNDYAAQIKPRDRWAIVAYIRALQFSQNANIQDLAAQDRQELERLPR
jgi:mono/diheme cytochrome c family protein